MTGMALVFIKRLGSRGFHDLFNQYTFYCSKHYKNYKSVRLWVILQDFLSDVLLMIIMNVKHQWDFILREKPVV